MSEGFMYFLGLCSIVFVVCLGIYSCNHPICEKIYSEWKGPVIETSGSGAVHVVEGMDIWTCGTPHQSYRPIGTYIINSCSSYMLFLEKDMVKLAREKRADALIQTNNEERVGRYNLRLEYILIRYSK